MQYFVPSFRRLGAKRGPSLIIPHIIIGAKTDAQDLQLLSNWGVQAVLNCAAQEVCTGATYYQQPRAPWPEGYVRYDHASKYLVIKLLYESHQNSNNFHAHTFRFFQ
jgi:hypothetical protein